MQRGRGALSSCIVLFAVIQILINKDKKYEFHIKELFLRGISSIAELIPREE
jgi:hypothetical protein